MILNSRKWRISVPLLMALFLNGCVLNLGLHLVQRGTWRVREHLLFRPHDETLNQGRDRTIDFGQGIKLRVIWINELSMWFGEQEITVWDYARFNLDDSQIGYIKTWPGYTENFPANNIQPTGAEEFCNFLNRRVRLQPAGQFTFRLPTVSEWEAAARCGDRRTYPWGAQWPPIPMRDGTLPNVGGEDMRTSKAANALFQPRPNAPYIQGYQDGFVGPCPTDKSGRSEYGLYGMAGNVSEWCLQKDGSYVLKGGDWWDASPEQLKITQAEVIPDRPWPFFPGLKDRKSHYGTGFRVVIGKR